MPDIKLPDGKKIPFTQKIDGFEISKKISQSLAKEACIMKVNGELKDLNFLSIKMRRLK
jgi:threonyl-tRNA synthetase